MNVDRFDPTCVFCEIIKGREEAEIVQSWWNAIAFVPLNPVTPGHVLVIPKRHVTSVGSNPLVSKATLERVAELVGREPANIITSQGPEATQTVFHLHFHIVPRREGDGLLLPWSKR